MPSWPRLAGFLRNQSVELVAARSIPLTVPAAAEIVIEGLIDPQAAFECRKPVRVSYRKNDANDCELFEPKVTVEMTRDSSRSEGSFAPTAATIAGGHAPKTQTDARKAFDDLFKP